MTHLVLLRGWPPNVEVLVQARSDSVEQGNVFGLPGGSAPDIVDDELADDDVRWRIRRRTALREACKELGHGPNHEFSLSECIFPEIIVGEKRIAAHEVCYATLPTRLREDFVLDVGTSVCFSQPDNRYFFMYHLDGDSTFFTTYWKPRATPEVRWKVDESVGEFGYLWQPLDRVLSLPLCSWAQNFFLDYDVQDALRYLGPGSAIHNGQRPYPAKTKRLTAKGKGKAKFEEKYEQKGQGEHWWWWNWNQDWMS